MKLQYIFILLIFFLNWFCYNFWIFFFWRGRKNSSKKQFFSNEKFVNKNSLLLNYFMTLFIQCIKLLTFWNLFSELNLTRGTQFIVERNKGYSSQSQTISNHLKSETILFADWTSLWYEAFWDSSRKFEV